VQAVAPDEIERVHRCEAEPVFTKHELAINGQLMSADRVSKRRRVLMVAFHFHLPEVAAPSGVSSSRYLPEFRWDVEVVDGRKTVTKFWIQL